MAQAHVNQEFIGKEKKKKLVSQSSTPLPSMQQQLVQHQQKQQHQQQHLQLQQQQQHQIHPSQQMGQAAANVTTQFGQVLKKEQYEKNLKMDLASQ
jgi:hypothetical protein